MADYKFDKIVTHLVTSGFVFAGSEIYGGLSNTWDYGPLGVEVKNNIRRAYWQKFVQESADNVGLDSAILMNPRVWEATGHVASFNDPLIDCKKCRTRHRADHLIEQQFPDVVVQHMSFDDLNQFIKKEGVVCPNCGASEFTDIRQFNMMFKTHIGVTDDSKSEVYLRPETAQGIFVNFKNIQRSQRKKIPFGVVQAGKSFRNEITPGNFTFRTREFEQMEMEFFCAPGSDLEWFAYWKKYCLDFIAQLGVKAANLRYRDHDPAELAFYSKATTDIEYKFPFGWGEIWGIADRTDYDLRRHQEYSKENLEYLDPETNTKYLPFVVEPSVGLDRLMLMALTDAYDEEVLAGDDVRIVMHLHPALATYKAAILPLSKKLAPKAEEIRQLLAKQFNVVYDETASIGKRYRRQDAIGTPYCITVDFDSLEDGQVTIRERDTMTQVRLPIDQLIGFFRDKVAF